MKGQRTFKSRVRSTRVRGAAIARGWLAVFTPLAALACLLAPVPVAAQPYPTRAIRMIVPFPPGGPIDTMARLVAHELANRLGQEVVIDNRPGAGSTLGARAAAAAEADGYTLLFGSSGSLAVA